MVALTNPIQLTYANGAMKQPSPAYLRHVACTAEDWKLPYFAVSTTLDSFCNGAIFARQIVSVLFVRLFSAAGSLFVIRLLR
jgi:hypothetical protein